MKKYFTNLSESNDLTSTSSLCINGCHGTYKTIRANRAVGDNHPKEHDGAELVRLFLIIFIP